MRGFTQTEVCWVDVFDHPIFCGKMRRFRGPIPLPICIADKHQWIGSVIVGPGAKAMLQWLEGGHLNRLSLKPKQIVADVKKLRITGKSLQLVVLSSATHNCSRSPDAHPKTLHLIIHER
jgi:hypothetical protein